MCSLCISVHVGFCPHRSTRNVLIRDLLVAKSGGRLSILVPLGLPTASGTIAHSIFLSILCPDLASQTARSPGLLPPSLAFSVCLLCRLLLISLTSLCLKAAELRPCSSPLFYFACTASVISSYPLASNTIPCDGALLGLSTLLGVVCPLPESTSPLACPVAITSDVSASTPLIFPPMSSPSQLKATPFFHCPSQRHQGHPGPHSLISHLQSFRTSWKVCLQEIPRFQPLLSVLLTYYHLSPNGCRILHWIPLFLFLLPFVSFQHGSQGHPVKLQVTACHSST